MNIQEIKVMLVTETKNQNNSIMMLLRNIISKHNVLEKQKGNKKIDVIEILKKEHKELNEELETCGSDRRIAIQEQLNFLNPILPQEMSKEEIKAVLERLDNKLKGKANMKIIMEEGKVLNKSVSGKVASEILTRWLENE